MRKKLAILGIVPLVLCCLLMLPHNAGADDLFGISFADGFSGTVSSWEPGEDSEMSQVAEEREYGIYFDETLTGHYGKLLSPFSLETKNDVVSFSMSIPDDASKELGDAGYAFYIGVQSLGSNDPVMFYKTSVEDNVVKATIPIWGKKVNCALVQVLPDNLVSNAVTSIQNLEAKFPGKVLENAHGAKLPFNLSFSIQDKTGSSIAVSLLSSGDVSLSIILSAQPGLAIDDSSVEVDSTFFKKGTLTNLGDGYWELTLEPKEDFYVEDSKGNKKFNDGASDALSKETAVAFDCNISSDVFEIGKTMYSLGAEVVVQGGYSGSWLVPPTFSAAVFDASSITMESAVTVSVVDMVSYEGGEEGYEGAVDPDGTTAGGSSSMPRPVFEIVPSKDTPDIQPTDLTFSTEDGEKSWTVKAVETAEGTSGETDARYYRFIPGTGQNPVRVTYTDKDGRTVLEDEFSPSSELFAEYTVNLYPGENAEDFSNIKVSAEDYSGKLNMSVNPGTLTVRSVAASDEGSVTSLVKSNVTSPVGSGKGEVVADPRTTYTLNDTDILIPDEGVSLLFDGIIDDVVDGVDSGNRTNALQDKVDDSLGNPTEGYVRNYQAQYLDLVDVNNGNAWVTASGDVTVYWGYPANTDENTDFKLYHFKGLHRDGENSGFEIGDLDKATVENVSIDQDVNGISFTVESGGFSPFVLTWDTDARHTINATAGAGGTISPSGEVKVADGGSQVFTITPSSGYVVDDVKVDGQSVGAATSYAFTNVTADHTIEATFRSTGGTATTYHTITASAGEGGSISPSGRVTVANHGSRSFSITADEGWTVQNVVVDGVNVGPRGSYTFSDVTEDHTISVTFTEGNAPADPDESGVSEWFDTDNHYAYLHGYGDGTLFGPENPMTRAEAAQMFYNLLRDKSGGDRPVTFEDVPEDAFYAEPVRVLASLGMINGTSPTTYEPDRPITRAEFVAIAMRFSNGEVTGENIFSDVPEDAWYRDYVVGAVGYGWILGFQGEDATFGPEQQITRSQATTVANRMLGRVADGAWIAANLDELKLFEDVPRGHFAFRDIVEATNAHEYERDGRYEEWTGLTE